MEVSKKSAENIIDVLESVVDNLRYHQEDLVLDDEVEEIENNIMRLNDIVKFFKSGIEGQE